MPKIRDILLALIATHFLLLTTHASDYTRYVNPFIGTGGHGHTFPGATTPFGMVQLSPDTRIDNWDGSSGYHYSDNVIYGFSHTHLSGTGIPDYCDILVMPTIGPVPRAESETPVDQYRSRFSHAEEKAEAGYYAVKLQDKGIYAEMTTTPRVGLHRYTFPETKEASIAVDLRWRDEVLDSHLRILGNRRFEGYRRSRSWAKDQIVYFAGEFSKDFVLARTEADQRSGNSSFRGKSIISRFQFETSVNEKVLLKVALSPVSTEGARKNLDAELDHWDFEKVRSEAKAAWNRELSRIEVAGGTGAQLTNFYTALYHTMIAPNIYQDVDGKYRGMDGVVRALRPDRSRDIDSAIDSKKQTLNPEPETPNPPANADAHYTVFSLWDTFRATHPLYTIIDERRTVQFINTFIRQYEQGGKLPVWELAGNETDTMIGYNAVSVIADAMAKGIEGFDYKKAYEAAKHSSQLDIEGLDAFRSRGYISMEDEQESVSRTLEYAYNSYCVAVMAKILGAGDEGQAASDAYDDDYRTHIARAQYYKNLFDKETGFMRPKQNGNWISPFDPKEVTFHFTEANSWQYTFFVPHDINGLIELYGGRENFANKLDSLFTAEPKTTGRVQPDITGLIGQYAHGNEPSHHIAYMYNWAGQPWKTQFLVRKIMDEFYKPSPNGLIGNEDCGQMSAWYVLSALGFYQVNPSVPEYAIGTPMFENATIRLENGSSFKIIRTGKGVYIKSLRLDGLPNFSPSIPHSAFRNGKELAFEMSETPVTDWFSVPKASARALPDAPAVPTIKALRVFEDKTTVEITTPDDSDIFYTIDGTEPEFGKNKYGGPFAVETTTTVKAVVFGTGQRASPTAVAVLNKLPNDWEVELVSRYSSQYTGGGPKGLIDGLRGTTNFASGEWQGYQDQDFEAVIDLKKPTAITRLGGSFLQVARSWIWMPKELSFEVSSDAENYVPVASIAIDFPEREMTHTIREYVKEVAPVTARFVRVKAKNLGRIPDWHPGAGFPAYIFVDEVFIR